MNNKTFMFVLVIVVVGMGALFMVAGGKETASAERMGTQYEELPALHIAPGAPTEYNSIPVTSGAHGERTEYGEFTRELTDYEGLHGLEHGGLSFWYNPETVTEDELAQIRDAFNNLVSEKRYLSPRSDLPENVKFSMASWGFLLEQEEISTDEMIEFSKANLNKGPELAP